MKRGSVERRGVMVPLPQPPEAVKGKSRKDTKRWCKGIVNREHQTVVTGWALPLSDEWDWGCDRCTVCGKQMRLRRIVTA